MRIITGKRTRVTSVTEIGNAEDLEKALASILDADICKDIVNLAYSEDDEFDQEVFIPSEDFFDTSLYDMEPKDVAMKFFNVADLDGKGAANPNKKYFRFDEDNNIESTSKPGDIYLDELNTEIVYYIMDHLDDRTFPDKVQEIIDEYLDTED
jgi:hypothetical protein